MAKLNKNDAKHRASKLKEVINDLRYRYHVLDDPKATDAIYDSLTRELRSIEDTYPDLITPDSPTQRVGGKPLKEFVSVTHKTPMLSLNDVFDADELNAWHNRLIKIVDEKQLEHSGYYAELKMDGLAVTLIYDHGILVQGATRGDGKVGEDITQNIKTIRSIPLHLREKSKWYRQATMGKVEVRGEVYLPKRAFEKLNEERQTAKLSLFANPRNAAAGSLRQLNSKITAGRRLAFMAYSLIGLDINKHDEEHQAAQDLGFVANGHNQFHHRLNDVVEYCRLWKQKRPHLPYQIDGVVININDKDLFERLGVVGKAPRGAAAFKWPAEEVTTIVENIRVQVGRTGTLTPVAELKPVEVAGSTISRATLHNEDEIKRKDIRINDTVVIRKAGDVIPEVVKPIKELRNGKEKIFSMPKNCLICGAKVVRKEGEVAWRCSNKQCFATQRRQIRHFVSRTAFDIEGLGQKIIDRFIEEGLIKDAADLFTLKAGDIEPLERFAEKSAANIIKTIQGHKKISLPRFIYALGILHVGEETAFDLAKHFGSLKALETVTLADLEQIPDIGPVVAKSICEYFQSDNNLKFIRRLLDLGIHVGERQKLAGKLSGQKFVLTGGLDLLSRDEAKNKIRQLGGEISETVSKDTTYVIVGKDPGSKFADAKKKKIKTINEKEFLKLL